MTDDFLRSAVSIDTRLNGVGSLVKLEELLNELQLNKDGEKISPPGIYLPIKVS